VTFIDPYTSIGHTLVEQPWQLWVAGGRWSVAEHCSLLIGQLSPLTSRAPTAMTAPRKHLVISLINYWQRLLAATGPAVHAIVMSIDHQRRRFVALCVAMNAIIVTRVPLFLLVQNDRNSARRCSNN